MSKKAPLADQLFMLPPREAPSSEEVLDRFLEYVAGEGLTLYPEQEEAILEVIAGNNVILSTPTGSGKSLVATAMHFLAMAQGRRSFYTSPIKALVTEKFFALCRAFGPDSVGMLTGDASVNREAPIVCCTAEILANMALREGQSADVHYVVMDEFHYYADRERGVAWQVPLLTLRRARFLLMSATLGPTAFFEQALTRLTSAPTVAVCQNRRPVPLDFSYREKPLHETILDLVRVGMHPIYLVNFTQRAAAEEAQNLMSTDFSSKEEKKTIHAALVGVRFDSPYGKEIQKYIRHGIGLHHAGLLPKYRRLVERLAQKGYLKIISGTDTLGVGVNIPIRTVLFTRLCKFDGEKTAILTVRDFQQISGRAGRKGFDEQGSVVAQAPEHVVENLRMEAKATGDPRKMKKLVKKKPPNKGYVHWDRSTFDRLVSSPPEPLVSRFAVSHGMLLNVLSRERGCSAMARLLRDCHDTEPTKRALGRTALQMFRSLIDAGIVERSPGRGVVVNTDLQHDFSLNHALSLYLLETIELLDRASETYALDLLTLVESILENPELVLLRQLDQLKTEKMAELKAAGIEFEARIAELEKLEHPKPNREFIYDTFNAFAKKHPWLGQENIRPKSVARDMFEKFQSFSEYIKEYGLERGEGLLLRYLSDVYKTLMQSVPAQDKTAEVDEIVTYFGAIVRAVDSTLLDEWERMRAGEVEQGDLGIDTAPVAPGETDVTANEKEFTVLVRNATFAIVRALARKDWNGAVGSIEAGAWTADRLAAELAPFFAEHPALRTDPKARNPENTRVVSKEDNVWRIEQILVDPEEANDWALVFAIDLDRSRAEARPVLELLRVEGAVRSAATE
jgi:superfamily II RNA helicase